MPTIVAHIEVSPAHASTRDGGFSLVEVIIAMLLLSVVVSAGVVAVASSDKAEVRSKAVADLHSIAERGFERAQGDLTSRSRCERPVAQLGAGWRQTHATAIRTNATAPTFAACTVTYDDFRDDAGRSFVVTLSITPVDSAGDGRGGQDVDNSLRDSYDVTTRVELAQDSKAGLEDLEPIVVNGSLDWTGSSTDLGTVRVFACGINRPDRSLTVGGCAVADTTKLPLANLPVTLTPSPDGDWNTGTDRTITTGGNGVGDATAVVEPGTYRVSAPASFTDSSGRRWNRFRIDPGGIAVRGAARHDINVTYVRETNRTITFCTQISTQPFRIDGITTDDGFEAYSTNVHYRGMGSPGYRSVRIDARRDRGWACARVIQPSRTVSSQAWLMYNPYGYANSNPFIGQYDLEIEQNYGGYRNTNRWGMAVSGVTSDCSNGLPWNRPLNGTPVPTRPHDPANDRPKAADEDPSWYGRYDLRDDRSHRICIRLEAKTLDRERCPAPPSGLTYPNTKYYKKGAAGAVPNSAVSTGKCFYVRTDCLQYCPDGGRICIRNCGWNWKGTYGSDLNGQAAKPFGGPADPSVGCRPRQQGGYAWYGWAPDRIWEGQVGGGTLESNWSQKDWVGGGSYYYNNFSGHYSSGGMFVCQHISFAASSKYLCHEGSNTPVSTSQGFIGCRFHFGDCIEAELPQYPGGRVRGIMRDVSVNYDKPIIPSINALRWLTLVNGIDKPETITRWDPGTWWNSLDLRIRVVRGDDQCGGAGEEQAAPNWPVYDNVEPVLQEIWHRIVDEPELRDLPTKPAAGNVSSDRVAI